MAMAGVLSAGGLAAVEAVGIGNLCKDWQESGLFRNFKTFETGAAFLSELEKPEHCFAVLSNAGKNPDGLNAKSSLDIMSRFVRRGGILVFDRATPTLFGSPGKPTELGSGETLLGEKKYAFSKLESAATESGIRIFGEDAAGMTAFLSGNKHCSLYGGGRMIMLMGTASGHVHLGVNRYGNGAVVYLSEALRHNGAYREEVLKLMRCLLDPKQRELHFPGTKSNDAISLNGKRSHLVIIGTDRGAALLREKLEAVTGVRNFVSSGSQDEVILQTVIDPGPGTEKLGPFGYRIVCTGNKIFLSGRTEKSVAYAAADFLKRYCSWRKFGYGSFCEVLPRLEFIQLPGKIDITEIPKVPFYNQKFSNSELFFRAIRLPGQSVGHTMHNLIPLEKYVDTHPEYYPMREGKRMSRERMLSKPWNPCMTNPDLPKLVKEYAAEFFRKNPDLPYLPLGVNDGGGNCRCPGCDAVYARNGNLYSEFYNMAARIVRQEHPGKMIGVIAYGLRNDKVPPLVMEDNIYMLICGIWYDGYKMVDAWKKAGIRHFGIYDYMYPFGTWILMPQYHPNRTVEEWRRAVDAGTELLSYEYYGRCDVFSAPQEYILSEVAWNPEVSPDELLRDYCETMFGKGAPFLMKFYRRLEEIWNRNPPDFYFQTIHDLERQLDCCRNGDVEYLSGLLADARKAADTPEHREKIGILEKMFGFISLYMDMRIGTRELATARITSPADAEKTVKEAERLYPLVEKIRTFSLTPEEEQTIFLPKNENLKSKYYGLDMIRAQSWSNPLPMYDNAVEQAFSRITAFLGDGAADFWRRHTGLPAARGQLWQIQNPHRTNLLANPGFETGSPKLSGNDPVEKTWDRNTIPGWGIWIYDGTAALIQITGEKAFSGKKCVKFGENEYMSCLNTSVPAAGGARYRFSFRVRRNDNNHGGELGRCVIRLTRNGKWFDEDSPIFVKFPPECVGKWIPLSVSFTVPPLSDMRIVPILAPPRQGADSGLYIDDCELNLITPGDK